MNTNGLHAEEPATLIVDDEQFTDGGNIQTAAARVVESTATTLEPLRPEQVRWFYKCDQKRWTKFDGYDSLSIEYIYRANFGNEEEASCLDENTLKYHDGRHTFVVRGGLYEVDLLKKKCTSIFWPGKLLLYDLLISAYL